MEVNIKTKAVFISLKLILLQKVSNSIKRNIKLYQGSIKFGCGGHLGRSSEMRDTILEEDHPRIISGNGQLKKFLFLVTAAILNRGRGCRTQF